MNDVDYEFTPEEMQTVSWLWFLCCHFNNFITIMSIALEFNFKFVDQFEQENKRIFDEMNSLANEVR